MRIPMTQTVAEYHGVQLDEYGTGEVQFDPGLGKLSSLIHSECDDLSTSEILIMSKHSQADKVMKYHTNYLQSSRSYEDFIDRIDTIQEKIDKTKRLLLSERDVIVFDWEPLDCVSMSPGVWFSKEISRAREIGLIFQINGQSVPESVMQSMGPKLVRIAKLKNLI